MNIRSRFFNKKMGMAEKIGLISLSLLLILLAWFALQKRFKLAYQYDDSVNFRIGIIDRGNKIPKKGDYCAFKFLAVKNHPRYGYSFVKRVACVEGDMLTHEGRDYYCNGKYLGRAKEYNKKGERLPIFEFNGAIPVNRFFASGENMESLDSKFWGFVDYQWVIGHVRKVI